MTRPADSISKATASLCIRRVRPTDANRLWRLFTDTVHSVNCRDYTPKERNAWAPSPFDADRWNASLQDGTPFVAEMDGRIVAFGERSHGGERIGRFYVSRHHQRQGIGRRLHEVVDGEARRRGVANLTVEASVTPRPFFERFGFGNARRQTVERRAASLTN